MKTKQSIWIFLYCILLCLFTVYVLLDTFVIAREYAPVTENPAAESESNPAPEPAEPIITETSYQDDNITITITEHRAMHANIHVADIRLSSPEYLRTALAQDTYGKNITATTSEIAESHGAILAINGDFYGARDRGYVMRNGILYRDTHRDRQQDLVIYKDGSFGIITEWRDKAEPLLEAEAYHILCFGPALVENGEVCVTKERLSGHKKQNNPRTAIGIIDTLHYVFVTVDGRTADSTGMTVHELAEFMHGLGATTAYNLDGGGSATMYFNGQVINTPTSNGDPGDERKVSDIVYIGYGS